MAVFDLVGRAGGAAVRLVDGVTCCGCGSVLIGPRLELAGDRRRQASRIVCVTCDAAGAVIAAAAVGRLATRV